MIVNSWQVLCAYIYVVSAVVALFIFLYAGRLVVDLLCGYRGRSCSGCWGHVSQVSLRPSWCTRELLQMLAYEPLLIVIFVEVWPKVAGSFKISDIMAVETPLLPMLPLLLLLWVLCS